MSIPSTCNTTATSYMSTKARNGNAPGEVKKGEKIILILGEVIFFKYAIQTKVIQSRK